MCVCDCFWSVRDDSPTCPLPVKDDGEVGLCLQFDIWGFFKFSFTL